MLRPSLSAKINIIKCFLLSQFVYIAAILEPSEVQINVIEQLLTNFLYPSRHTFNKQKTFSPVSKGGLGLPVIKDFFRSLRTKFALRAASSQQPWARELSSHFIDNEITNNVRNETFYKSEFTKLRIECCKSFQQEYYNNALRIWKCPIFVVVQIWIEHST